jgi:DNA polymerase III subunit epsilon
MTSSYRILVLDTETTGLSVKDSRIIELAALTYCTKTRTDLCAAQFLIPTDGGNAAEHINHIPPAALRERPVPALIQAFREMYADADCIVAHNADFDRRFVLNQWPDLPERPWVCSVKDLKFPRATNTSRKLSHLAVDHGVNPTQAHRAMGDVIVLTSLLSKIPDLDRQIQNAITMRGRSGGPAQVAGVKAPKFLFEVVDSQYELRHIYKQAKFDWNWDKKRWEKRLAKGAEVGLPFRVQLADVAQSSGPPAPDDAEPSEPPPSPAVA